MNRRSLVHWKKRPAASDRLLCACIAAALLGACAGSGDGLDESGRPLDETAEPLIAELASIQRHVFTPVCTACHAGAAAPLGLRLDEDASFAMLVDVPSVQVPALNRVEPGNPDASYLIHKLEGTAAVGARMPFGGPPLPQETIDVIRQWIFNGALPQGAVVSELGSAPATLQAIWPVPDAKLAAAPQEIVLAASTELDTNLLATGIVSLHGQNVPPSAAAMSIGQAEGGELPVSVTVRTLAPTVFAVILPEQAQRSGTYRLRVSGTPPLALADLSGRPIDGNGDGEAGGDFVVQFAVEEAE